MGFSMLHQKSMLTLSAVVTGVSWLAPGLPVAPPQEAAGPSHHSKDDKQLKGRAEVWVHHEAIL
jgi:hypothetical protein